MLDAAAVSDLATPRITEFRLNDRVRLVDRHGNVPSGTCGCILGMFGASTDRGYIVSFEGERACVVDVRFDEIVLAHAVRAST